MNRKGFGLINLQYCSPGATAKPVKSKAILKDYSHDLFADELLLRYLSGNT